LVRFADDMDIQADLVSKLLTHFINLRECLRPKSDSYQSEYFFADGKVEAGESIVAAAQKDIEMLPRLNFSEAKDGSGFEVEGLEPEEIVLKTNGAEGEVVVGTTKVVKLPLLDEYLSTDDLPNLPVLRNLVAFREAVKTYVMHLLVPKQSVGLHRIGMVERSHEGTDFLLLGQVQGKSDGQLLRHALQPSESVARYLKLKQLLEVDIKSPRKRRQEITLAKLEAMGEGPDSEVPPEPIEDMARDRKRHATIALRALAGLEALHAAGILHNDAHDDNVFVTDDAIIFIDAGMACVPVRSPALGHTMTIGAGLAQSRGRRHCDSLESEFN